MNKDIKAVNKTKFSDIIVVIAGILLYLVIGAVGSLLTILLGRGLDKLLEQLFRNDFALLTPIMSSCKGINITVVVVFGLLTIHFLLRRAIFGTPGNE